MQKSFQPVTARSPRRIRDLHNAGDEEALVASAQDRSPEAERLPSGRDDMLFESAHLVEAAALPQHLGKVEHRRQRVGMRLTPLAAQRLDALLLLRQGRHVAHLLTLPPNAFRHNPLM